MPSWAKLGSLLRQLHPGIPECSPVTLRFKDPKTEAGFLQSRKDNLIKTCKRASFVAMVFAVGTLCHKVLVAQRLSRKTHVSDLSLAVSMVGFWCHLVATVLVVMFFSLTCSRRAMRRCKPSFVEAYGSFTVNMLQLLAPVSQYDTVSKLFGHDPVAVCESSCGPFSDSQILMGIVGCVTVVHTGLPVRWCLLLPLEFAGVALYVVIVFAIGSNETRAHSFFNLAFLTGFVLTTSWGKRAAEIGERRSWLNLIEEKSLRCHAEFTLSQMSERADRDRDRSGGEAVTGRTVSIDQRSDGHSVADSVPTTTPSGGIFNSFFNEGQDISTLLVQVAELGDREHWRIRDDEVCPIEGEPIGSGSFGVVEKAGFCGLVVAVKRPYKRLVKADSRSLPELCNELRIIRRLRHPNIVCVHGAIIEPHCPSIALVLELVTGMTLTKFVSGMPQHADRRELLPKYRIILGVCRALLYIHSRSPHIVHGDLKCGNIMVEGGGDSVTPKLLDFGLSRVLTQTTRKLGGTLAWMAPEVCSSRGPVKRSADVYSFGRLIAFIATGIPPLSKMASKSIKQALRDNRPPPATWPLDCAFTGGSCEQLVADCIQGAEVDRPTIEDVHEQLLALPFELGLTSRPGLFIDEVQELACQVQRKRLEKPCQRDEDSPEPPGGCQRDEGPPELPKGRLSGVPEDEIVSGEAALSGQQLSGPASPGETAPALSGGSNTGTPAPPEAKWRRVQRLPKTSDEVMSLSLLSTLMRWNFQMQKRPCCHLHGVLDIASQLIREQRGSGCVNFPITGDPCPTCGIFDVETNEEHCCNLCGAVARGSGDELMATRPSSVADQAREQVKHL